MLDPKFKKETWYEVQRIYDKEDILQNSWSIWEIFPYDPTTKIAQTRLNARNRAKKELKSLVAKGFESRIIHCELIHWEGP